LTFVGKYVKKKRNQNKIKMNTAQKIINLILKMMYYEDFKSSLSEEERACIQDIRNSDLKHVKISSEKNDQSILVWGSGIGETVACYISDSAVYFSSTVAYKHSTGRMKDGEDEKLSQEQQRIVDSEVTQIKSLFTKYFEDTEKYFH